MATAIQFRRGSTAQHANFTGLVGEITVDTDLDTIRVHDGSTAGGTRLAKYDEVVAAASGDITAVTTVAGSGLTGGSETGNVVLSLDYENLTGNLVPSANNTYSLGSLTSVWKDVFVGPGSLYVNGQKVLEDNAGTIQFSADNNQNISILTTGGGDVEIQSGGTIQLKSNVVLSSGKVITTAGGAATKFTANINMNSNNINNVDNPVQAQDAATKAYVDTANTNMQSYVDALDTDDIAEGANKYFTDAGARGAISATDAGGDGSLVYNSGTGVITYTGPSAAEVEARMDTYLTGGEGVNYSAGDISVDNTVVRTTGAQTIAGSKTFSDDMVVSGNLTISGVQTIVNSTITSLADSIIELNRDAVGIPSEDAGFSVNRGSDADVSLLWDETNDEWTFSTETVRSGNLVPDGNTSFNLGSASNRWDSLYMSDSGINMAGATISAPGGVLKFNNANIAVAGSSSYTTSDLTEGTNQYFTDARARGAISATKISGDGSIAYNSTTGVISYTGPSATEVRAHFAGGTGVTISTGTISIGQSVGTSDNVVFSQVTAALVGNVTGDVTGDLIGDVTGDVTGTVSSIANHDTADLAEGTNLYFTAARARGNISASGDLSYNSTTGVMSFTERTDAEVRGLLSGGTGISYNSGTGAISLSDTDLISGVTAGTGLTGGGTAGNVTLNIGGGTGITVNADDIAVNMADFDTDDLAEGTSNRYFDNALARAAISASGDLSYSSATGVISFTERTDAEVRGLLSGGTGITYNSATGAISLTDTGYVTGVTAGTGLTGGGTDGTVTVNVDTGAVADGSAKIPTANDVYDFVIGRGYSTTTGTVTSVGVTTSAGLDGSGTVTSSGSIALSLNLAELTDMTADVVGSTDELILLDAGSQRRKAINEIKLSQFSNDAGWTTNVGDITGVTAGTNLNGGGASGSVTLNLDTTLTGMAAATFSGTVTAGLFSGTATAARYADLAEKYTSDADYEPGTVVKFGGEAEITQTTDESDPAVVGVISTDPAYMMNKDIDGLYVALAGRVPCKVIGPVAKGDLMVSAANGRAKADNNAQAGRIIGKAIEAHEGGEGVIEVLVNMM